MARRTQFFVQTFRAPTAEYNMSWSEQAQWQPRMDIYQTDDEILIHVEAAGVREKDLSLTFEDGNLIVRGKRTRPDLPCPQHCLQVEISYGEFSRVLALPRDVDSQAIHAEYSEGLLRVTIPRRIPDKQSIQIGVS